MHTKSTIRKEICFRRNELSSTWIKENSKKIVDQIRQHRWFKLAKEVALYNSLQGEVDLSELFYICWKEKKRTVVPVYSSKTNQYIFARFESNTSLCRGRYQIEEPCNPIEIPLSQIDLIFVPGVAFNPTTGDRLGRGGGYYDRLLQSFKGHTIGVAFSFQLYSKIPIDPTDQQLDLIITESKKPF